MHALSSSRASFRSRSSFCRTNRSVVAFSGAWRFIRPDPISSRFAPRVSFSPQQFRRSAFFHFIESSPRDVPLGFHVFEVAI